MIIRAPRPDTGYLTVRNEVVRDGRLSLKARGLLLLILSYPDNWETSAERLMQVNKEGRSAILSALTELKDAGYIRQTKIRNARGQISTETRVFDQPESENLTPVPTRGNGASPLVTPEAGYPASDSPTPKEEPSTKQTNNARTKRPRPDDWQPNDQHRSFSLANGLDVDQAAEDFKDWHDARGSKFVNWDAAFRTWIRKAASWGQGKQQAPARAGHEW